MAIEIRELIIKTEIVSSNNHDQGEQNLDVLKRELLEACRRMMLENQKRINQKR
jgi:hypothetical protein